MPALSATGMDLGWLVVGEDEDMGIVVGGVEAEDGGVGVGDEVLDGGKFDRGDFDLVGGDPVLLADLFEESLLFSF